MEIIKLKADIAIIGAGISGLYAAWRILSQQRDAKVLILEQKPKTGGRLDSDTLEITDIDGVRRKVKDEEGGMRFNESMVELYKLFKELDLSLENGKIVPFNMADPNGRFYLRDCGFTQKQLKDSKNSIWSEIYKLNKQEVGKSPGTLVGEVLRSVLQANENKNALAECVKKYRLKDSGEFLGTPEQWSDFRNKFTYKGAVIHSWGLWPLLTACGVSNEAITMITKAIGFSGPIAQDINAGEQLQILGDFPNNPQFFTLNAGFESLTEKLEKNITQGQNQASILLNTKAVSVDESDSTVTIVAENSGQETALEISCSSLLITLPKLALESLMESSIGFPSGNKLKEDLDRLQGMRLAKINLYYQERWWHQGEAPICHGGSFTDLPAGAVYVFDPIYPYADNRNYDEATVEEKVELLNRYGDDYNGPSALTVYCDYDNTTFWKQLQCIGAPYLGSHPIPEFATAASTAVVDELHKQLSLILNRTGIPAPVTSTFRLWGDDEYGFGYHQWKLKTNDAEIRESIWRVAKNIFLSNEAYSDMQGWVNGSLRSTDIMLEKGLGIKPLLSDKERPALVAEMIAAARS